MAILNGQKILALAMRGLKSKKDGREINISEKVHELYEQIQQEGLDIVNTSFFVTMRRFIDLPREIELKAAINRMRHVTWISKKINEKIS